MFLHSLSLVQHSSLLYFSHRQTLSLFFPFIPFLLTPFLVYFSQRQTPSHISPSFPFCSTTFLCLFLASFSHPHTTSHMFPALPFFQYNIHQSFLVCCSSLHFSTTFQSHSIRQALTYISFPSVHFSASSIRSFLVCLTD